MADDDSIQPGNEVWLEPGDASEEAGPAPLAPARSKACRRARMSIVTEVGVFCIGLGLLLTLAGGALLMAGGGDATLAGIPRRLILAVPMVSLGLLHLVSGTLVMFVRGAWTVVLCMVVGAVLFVAYCGVMIITGVGVGFNCISLVMIAIPAALCLRGREALTELSGSCREPQRAAARDQPVWRARDES